MKLNRIADELLRDVELFAVAVLSRVGQKAAFFAAEATLGFRDSLGRARRSP